MTGAPSYPAARYPTRQPADDPTRVILERSARRVLAAQARQERDA